MYPLRRKLRDYAWDSVGYSVWWSVGWPLREHLQEKYR